MAVDFEICSCKMSFLVSCKYFFVVVIPLTCMGHFLNDSIDLNLKDLWEKIYEVFLRETDIWKTVNFKGSI